MSEGNRRILIADDDPQTVLVLRQMLSREGFVVESVEDGEQCLEMADRFHPALIILDIMMPKVHGIDVLRRLGARGGGLSIGPDGMPGTAGDGDGGPIGVIVCSARAFRPDMERARELGAIAFLVKPLRRKEVLDAVNAYFGRADSGVMDTPGPAGSAGGGSIGLVTGATSVAAAAGAAPLGVGVGASGTGAAGTHVGAGGGGGAHVGTGAAVAPFVPVLDSTAMMVRLWGTRGSIPVPGQKVVRHGGNTSCAEIRLDDDVVILDAGSGIRELGLELARQGPRAIHLFIGHTHWDHIQGFPFFAPAYIKGFKLFIYGASGFGKDLRSVFQGQLDRDYFPVEMRDMAATMEFRGLENNPVEINDLRVYWEFMHHPGATIGFRVEGRGTRVAYVSDNEFLHGYVGHPTGAEKNVALLSPYAKLVEFLMDVDVLIGEAQYFNEEYPKKIGWGHTSLSNACLLAKLARAKRWVVTHHDPLHDDETLERKLNLTRQVMRQIGWPIPVSNGYDGLTEYFPTKGVGAGAGATGTAAAGEDDFVEPGAIDGATGAAGASRRVASHPAGGTVVATAGAASIASSAAVSAGASDGGVRAKAARSLRVLLAEDNPVNQEAAVRILERRGHQTVVASTGVEAVDRSARERFDVILMDVQMPEMDGYAATAAIRAREAGGASGTSGQPARRTPIVAMTAHAMAGDREKCLAAGMDGYVSKPINRQELFRTIETLAVADGGGGGAGGVGGGDASASAAGTSAGHANTPGAAAANLAAETALDVAALLDNADGDLNAVHDLFVLYQTNREGVLTPLREGVRAGDAKAIEKAAHKLAGTMAAFFATSARGAASSLETAAREGRLGDAAQRLADIERKVDEVEGALRRLLARQG